MVSETYDFGSDEFGSFETDRFNRTNLRCSCCNSVSSEDIADDVLSRFTRATMHEDPRDHTRIICSECFESVVEAVGEFGDFEE